MNCVRRLVHELCDIIYTFICQDGTNPDMERCPGGVYVLSKGCTQPICTVKLEHGQIYNIEFVYKFWMYKLACLRYPFNPCFIISNNGLATTLKCFLCEPRHLKSQFGECLSIESDVYLKKNSSVFMSQDDFIKFKTNLVFTKDLGIFNSLVVCRTYLTEHRQALQFLVVQARSVKRVNNILGTVINALKPRGTLREDRYNEEPLGHENIDTVTQSQNTRTHRYIGTYTAAFFATVRLWPLIFTLLGITFILLWRLM
uniref:Tegument protein n=1 Tax=Bovine herpesvirus 4 TaxID=10385 RepID=A0A0F6N4U6_BHV4|nr:tegument protein [Bovine gammaherpesvirus 4]QJC19194.1 tegument protein [Bovine gammaherpesvirus 4]WEM32528.1 tegument protein [Bovine gammaherpesvirus 4]